MEDSEIITKLIISVGIGIILGGEREYRNKSAGLRTIILICLCSTIFTILSQLIGHDSGSRIAANVVTGIGFLGAGAIMRERLGVSGLTTASTIWVAAALGASVGLGYYALALYAVALCFLILTLFEHFQTMLFKFMNKTIELRLSFDMSTDRVDLVEAQMNLLHLKFSRKKELRRDTESIYFFEVVGKEANLSRLATFLNRNTDVKGFEY